MFRQPGSMRDAGVVAEGFGLQQEWRIGRVKCGAG